MIIDIVVASTSRFNKFGPVSSPEEAEDLSGKVIRELIEAAGHRAQYRLLPDGIEPIREAVEESVADAVILCGGTGLTHLDLTLEAVEPLFEKTLPGFGEIFRWRSWRRWGPGPCSPGQQPEFIMESRCFVCPARQARRASAWS